MDTHDLKECSDVTDSVSASRLFLGVLSDRPAGFTAIFGALVSFVGVLNKVRLAFGVEVLSLFDCLVFDMFKREDFVGDE